MPKFVGMKMKMKRILLILLGAALVMPALAQVTMSERTLSGANAFPLVERKAQATVLVSEDDYTVVRKAAGMLIDDVRAVTGRTLSQGRSSCTVIAGTLGRSDLIREVVSRGKLDVSAIEGGWEQYVMQVVRNPLPGIGRALVIAGSDRRGTAYGLLSLSEAIGQNPWYWWADVPAKQHSQIYLNAPRTVSKTPSVKYRGIFINDEDWGLTPWASKTFEPEVGNIGPRTYAKVCELLLRLGANYLCPAMHPVSTAFYQIPENKLVADSFAIVMGTSHCEPLFLNTASEWKSDKMGPWDYDKNRQGILSVLEGRVRETIPYENVYTLALRGLHDAHMNTGDVPMREKVRLLQSALMDQRNLIAQNTQTAVEEVPQAFTPYKEVLDIYSAGLELQEDITIIWPDDNFGYMKRLSNPTEQRRSGRSGVYYHLSYLGVPHSYLWVGTTPPSLMYEELRKAYDTTADRIWVANCGDLKGTEASVALFLAMARDIDSFNRENVTEFHAKWLAQMFGSQYYDDLLDITRSQSRLCFQRKPEYMGFGYWSNCWGTSGEKRTDTGFSFMNYNEADRRLAEYQRIGQKSEALYQALPEAMKPAFLELLYYPVKGSELMNRMNMGGQLYRQYVRQGRAASVPLRKDVEALHDSLEQFTRTYNTMLGGKWNHVMSLEQNYGGMSAYFKVPRMEAEYKPTADDGFVIVCEGEDNTLGRKAYHELPVFSKYLPTKHWVDAIGPLRITAPDWVKTKIVPTGYGILRIWVDIDWEKAPVGESIKAALEIGMQGDKKVDHVLLSVFNPATPTVDELRGIFVENDGVVSFPAADFTRKFENDRLHFYVVPDMGVEGSALQMGDPTAPLQPYREHLPNSRVEYDFYTFNAGLVDVYTYVLPTFPLHSERDYRMPEHTNVDTKYSVRIDEGNLSSPTSSATEYTHAWYDAVLANCRVNKSTLYIHEPGRHVLSIRVGDPGMVLQKVVIDLGGQRHSYAGPPSTLVR